MLFPLILQRIYDDKSAQEEIIRTSGLDWTIVRPGILTNNVPTDWTLSDSDGHQVVARGLCVPRGCRRLLGTANKRRQIYWQNPGAHWMKATNVRQTDVTDLASPLLRPAIALISGAVCHACFVLGVGTMIVAMYFGMSRSLGALEAPWSWIANAFLLAQFPIAHSFLLTNRGRALLARLAPAGMGSTLSSTTYVTIASLQILALFALWSPSDTIWWQAVGPVLVLMSTPLRDGLAAARQSHGRCQPRSADGVLGLVGLARNRTPIYPRMPENGLFRLSRQPIYVTFTLTVWTVPTWTPDQLVVAMTFTLYCLFGPLFKEARFRRIYGSAFDTVRVVFQRRSATTRRSSRRVCTGAPTTGSRTGTSTTTRSGRSRRCGGSGSNYERLRIGQDACRLRSGSVPAHIRHISSGTSTLDRPTSAQILSVAATLPRPCPVGGALLPSD